MKWGTVRLDLNCQNITAAPRPGFNLSDMYICSPVNDAQGPVRFRPYQVEWQMFEPNANKTWEFDPASVLRNAE